MSITSDSETPSSVSVSLSLTLPSRTTENSQNESLQFRVGSNILQKAKDSQRAWGQINQMVKSISANLRLCLVQHNMYFGLFSLSFDSESIDFYLSLCEQQGLFVVKELAGCHPVKFCRAPSLASPPLKHPLCRYLREASKWRLPALISSSSEGISKFSIDGNEMENIDTLSLLSDIRFVLESEEFSPFLSTSGARRSQYLLANALSVVPYSFWNAKMINFKHIKSPPGKAVHDLTQPYISCSWQAKAQPNRRVNSRLKFTQLLILIGLLFLRLELREIAPDFLRERKNIKQKEAALERCLRDYKDYLDETIHQVISNCLNFHKYVDHIDSSDVSAILEVRMAILQYILLPLEEDLIANHPSIAAEILSPLAQPEQKHRVSATELQLQHRPRKAAASPPATNDFVCSKFGATVTTAQVLFGGS